MKTIKIKSLLLLVLTIYSNTIFAADDLREEYQLLDNVPIEYKKYNAPPWKLLKLPDFNKAYWDALQPIKNKKLTPYLKRLSVASSSHANACSTPDGLAMIYSGKKPHWASDTITIVFFPDSKRMGMYIEDEFVEYQNGYFGTINQTTSKILNNLECQLD